ncbi:glycoside hydrolase family 130 protein [soil metagenome]
MNAPTVRRQPLILKPDPTRVLVRPFLIASEARALKIVSRVLTLGDEEVARLLADVLHEFGDRHIEIRRVFLDRFELVKGYLPTDRALSEERRLLIGSYFTNEYSFESAALFNPSIVEHPDQTGAPEGGKRFILSLRATGEGHISSITFRSGSVFQDGTIELDVPDRCVTEPKLLPSAEYERELFRRKLLELGVDGVFSKAVLDTLGERFTLVELVTAVKLRQRYQTDTSANGQRMILLAQSNYEIEFGAQQSVSQRTIFPISPSESNGIEDARFVRFQDDDGTQTYYATYTAYDGRIILPQLLETKDFLRFKICTLNGPAVQNKGMALFPRKINGRYVMLSRQDGENILIMYSEDLHFWYEAKVIMKPSEPWEFVQLGNCGSPIETDAGWLMLTHGVGPMRKYCIGAALLDRDDPSRLIGRLKEPLIKPEEREREGYVPNVVYTCGALVHDGLLILPYAVSDSASAFATVPLADVLGAMTGA